MNFKKWSVVSWQWSVLMAGLLFLVGCFGSKKTPRPAPKPPGSGPSTDLPYGKMDTIRWQNDTRVKPIPSPGAGQIPSAGGGDNQVAEPGKTYRIALLLPFLTDKFVDSTNARLPKNSGIALQFYAGAKLALAKLSSEPGINLQIEVVDSKVSDADFQAVLKNPFLKKADVLLGGFRGSHVQALADFGKLNGKIIVSPDIATPSLARQNPDFIQLNPSLRAHCETLFRYASAKNPTAEIVLVCREKERERLVFIQNQSQNQLPEIVSPDADEQFKVDLKPYFKPGRTTVFILPTWSSQDFVNSFFQKVKAQRGKTPVEIYGMPQWREFENIEADDFENLHVHLSAARFARLSMPETDEFRQAFFNETGTIPTDDAFNGYDATLFLGRILKKYGSHFPEKLASASSRGLASKFEFRKIGATSDRADQFDYWENGGVQILRFENYRFVPVN